jgi:CRISPR/Cas system-associated exonuclease Cas4 (RecB family)
MTLIALGVVVLLVAWLLGRTTGVPVGTGVIASDVGLERSATLEDSKLRIRGRPDYLLREPASGRIYPVEVKPSRTSRTLQESDALQLGVYMLLTAAQYGAAFAGYGVVRYRSGEFRLAFTPELRDRCIAAAEAVRAARRARTVHRDHTVRAKCGRCGVRRRCGEAL